VSGGNIGQVCDMRSSLKDSLIRSLCMAACWLVLALPTDALDSKKPVSEYTHTVWTHKDGLPSAFIYSIAQTQDGYLWLGTADGLVRFDGARFVHWRSEMGHKVLLGAVHSVCVARDGGLWVGTASGMLGHIRGDDLTVSSDVGAQPETMLEDRGGTLWVATDNRLRRLDAVNLGQIGAEINLPGSFLSGLLQEGHGSIWFSTTNGVFHLDPSDPQRRLVQIAHGKFWLSADSSGNIWLTSPDGSTQSVAKEQMVTRVGIETGNLAIHTVIRETNGNNWIGTLGQGLARVRADSNNAGKMEVFSQADGLSANSAWCLLEDREGNIWVGTQNGLNRFRDEKIATLTRHEGLAADSIDALAARSDGSVWASTSHGIQRIDGEHRELYLPGASVLGLFVDRKDTLWAGTNRGVAQLQDGIWRYVHTPTGIQFTAATVIAEDDRHGIWICDAGTGLYRWTNGRITDFSQEPQLKGKSILAASADDTGKVWFGLYEGGVVVFDGNRFRAYSERDGLAGGTKNAVYTDEKGALWIGAEHGLSRFDGQRFTSWNSANGLPGDRVQWVLTDRSNRLWLGYSTGVACLNRSELDRAAEDSSYRVAVQFFDDADGLKGNPDRQSQSAAVRCRDGTIWLRTSEGVAIVDPQHITQNLIPPPVHIERLLADGAAVNSLQAIRLRPLTRDVEIDYTAMSFAEPRNVRFRYKLEGFDSDWRDAGARRQAFYTNLPPHAYRFRVLACNNDGVWNESGAILDLTLLPAFYQTRSFVLLCTMVLIIVSWSVYRWRVWQVTDRLRDRFEVRLKERTRLAQELHDNVIQDVMGISLQIEVTDELLPADFPAKQPVERALRLCRSALDEGRRALTELRSGPLSSNDLVNSLSQLSDEFAGDSEIQVDVVVEGRERPLNALPGNDVLQIGRQAVTNALHHAHAKTIHVLLSYGDRNMEVRVQDNGVGINPETLNLGRPGHFGISGMKERAERLGGSISIRSYPGEGTEVNLTVPAHLLYQNDVPRSGWRLRDRLRNLTERLRVGRPKSGKGPEGTPTKSSFRDR
jgi:signal transduction histidine kinase/ligand-binding sensor domain-containing protein